MSTVTEIIDQVCRHSGIDSATGTDDRNEAIRAVNRAYKRIFAEARPNKLSQVITVLSATTSLTVTGIGSIVRVWRVEDGIELDAVSLAEIQRRLATQTSLTSGKATAYSYDPVTDLFIVDAYSSSDGVQFGMVYTGSPAALVEGGDETTILIDPLFHEDLLGALGTCYILEGYEGQEERAAYYRSLVRETMQLYRESLWRNRGERVASDHGGRWPTAAPASAR